MSFDKEYRFGPGNRDRAVVEKPGGESSWACLEFVVRNVLSRNADALKHAHASSDHQWRTA